MAERVAGLAALASVLASILAAGPAEAQSKTRIWDVALGTPVADLPADFIMQACGSNGGPPRAPLNGFADFRRCPVEPETGLREVWFSYDDIEEYFLRSHRIMGALIDAVRANVLFEQLVIYSLLIDNDGRVQGYRIISDPREDPQRRWEADTIARALRNVIFGAFDWTCENLPPLEGEMPFRDQLTKEICRKESNGRSVTMDRRVLLKPGQRFSRPGEALQQNEFDVRLRIEVIGAHVRR